MAAKRDMRMRREGLRVPGSNGVKGLELGANDEGLRDRFDREAKGKEGSGEGRGSQRTHSNQFRLGRGGPWAEGRYRMRVMRSCPGCWSIGPRHGMNEHSSNEDLANTVIAL